MKCISLWQPWASLLVSGEKRIETRGWFMHHRGPLLIHAARHWDKRIAAMCQSEPFKSSFDALSITWGISGKSWMPSLPFGCVIGRVDVQEVFPTSITTRCDPAESGMALPLVGKGGLFISEKEWEFGDYSWGRFAILCTNPVRFERPTPFAGKQGLFNVPDELIKSPLQDAEAGCLFPS